MTERTLAQQLADFAVGATYHRLPGDVVASVQERVLDTLGICYAATGLETSRGIAQAVAGQGGAAQATALGVADRVPAGQAALMNGVLAHSLDYDDTHLPSVLHPSATVVPTALAVAQAAHADGPATIAAIAVGLEAAIRLGMAGYDRESGNSTFFEHGQHATSICGAVGSAISAAMLLGLDSRGICDSIGVAGSMASGIIESNRNGGTVKRLHCGWAAHAAVNAAQFAKHGMTGPTTVLEGRFGFFQAWLHGRFDPSAITDGLGEQWSVPGIFFKPYPANHFTHAAVDAALELRTAGLQPDQVASVEIGVAAPTVRTIGEPIEVKRAPRTGYMAQFSLPYVFAAALSGGGGLGLSLGDFTDVRAQDPDLRRLMARIEVRADSRCDAVFPYHLPAIVRVRTVAGEVLTSEVMVNRGSPGRPLSTEELSAKFADNVSGVLDDQQAEQVCQAVTSLPKIDDVSALLIADVGVQDVKEQVEEGSSG